MMRLFTLFIIFFSISGTVWSMWLSSELKNEEARLKIIKNKIIVLAGIAYKSDVADTRQSPSKNIYEFLKKNKAKILCVDPLVRYWDEKKVNVENISYKFKKIDAIIFAVPHQQFKKISPNSFQNNKAFIFDCNNCLSIKQRNELKKRLFKVKIIGDGTF